MNKEEKAFPKITPDGDNIQPGLTKYEYTVIHVLAALSAKGGTISDIAFDAIRVTDELFKQLNSKP